MIVVNLFAGPGVGKSTLAADVFARLKKEGVNVELVTEYAKQLTWENRVDVLDDQIYVFAKQSRAVRRVRNKVDVVITDAPLLQSCAYIGQDIPEGFAEVINSIFSQYNNYNFFLSRSTNYQSVGRNQDEEGAKELDRKVESLLRKYHHTYNTVDPRDERVPDFIVEGVKLILDGKL